tara:strand:- start:120 stop:1421 length:1302 start_codon:yes stop_codon:yes gene_type:complete
MNKTILLGLNELNFDYMKFYIDQGLLPNFKKLFDIQAPIETTSESEYELLEPWIQWASVHTGKTFEEHKILRLGDIVDRPELSQIFEELEREGLSVGAVSPFNADNRLKEPSFFIPDPWTRTKVSGNSIVKALYQAIHQSVNDNAQEKLKVKSLFSLGLGLLLYVPISRWSHYVKYILKKNSPGSKAIILDSILTDVFLKLWKNKIPDFSNLFLNSGAHIQHHYLFNSKAYKGSLKNPEWYCDENFDPLIKILEEYDRLIGKLVSLKNTTIIVATGLHQQPHNNLTFYWRLNDLEKFAQIIGLISFKEIIPRMSRDFLINFESSEEAKNTENLLNDFVLSRDSAKIFNIDNRGASLFVELIYPNNVLDTDSIISRKNNITVSEFKKHISFVAIKNGEHNGVGYLTSNINLKLPKQIKLIELKTLIKKIALGKK